MTMHNDEIFKMFAAAEEMSFQNWRIYRTLYDQQLKKKDDLIQQMQVLLHDASDFLDNHADVIDGNDGQPEANHAMILKQEIDRLLENRHA